MATPSGDVVTSGGVTPEQKANMSTRITQEQGNQLPAGWAFDEPSAPVQTSTPQANKGAQISAELKAPAANNGLPSGWTLDPETTATAQVAELAQPSSFTDKLKQSADAVIKFAVDSVHPKQPSVEDENKTSVSPLEAAGRAYLSGQHQLGKTAGMVAAAPAVAADYLKNIVGKEGDTSVQDFVFRNWVAPHDVAIEKLATQPYEKQGFVSKVASGIGGLLADLPYMIASGGVGAPEVGMAAKAPTAIAQTGKVISQGFDVARPLMVKAASDKAEQVLNNGGSKTDAANSAITAAMLTGYMMSAPMSVESKLFGRLASGAPLYAATSEASRLVQNAADPSQLYQPFNLENFGVNMATGSVLAASLGHKPQESQIMTPHEQAKTDAEVLKSGEQIPDADPQRIKNASLVAMMGDNKAVEHAIDSGNQSIIDSMLAVSPKASETLEKIKAKAAEAEPTAMTEAFANAKVDKAKESAVVSAEEKATPEPVAAEPKEVLPVTPQEVLPVAKPTTNKGEMIKAEKAANAAKIAEASKTAAHSPESVAQLPTEAQQAAGNYPKGHVNINGLDISIENPKGSVRSGVSEGKSWQVKMQNAYGYIRKTEGADGDHMDVYLGDHITKDTPAYIVDQVDPKTGLFDEHKVVMGARGYAEAKDIYDAHFADKSGPERRAAITKMPMDELKTWLKGDTTQPLKHKDIIKTKGEFNFDTDMANETKALARLAHQKGYESVDDFATNHPDEFKATTEKWRAEHPVPEEQHAEQPKEEINVTEKAKAIESKKEQQEAPTTKPLYAYPTESAAIAAEKRQRAQGFDEGKVVPHPTEDGRFAVVAKDNLKLEQNREEYGGEHSPPDPENGAPLHDLTGGGNIYPDDIYSSKAAQYYGHFGNNDPMDRQTIDIIHSLKDKPNASVTMYRAVPKETTKAELLSKLEGEMNAYQRRGKVPADATLQKSAWYNDAWERRAKLEQDVEAEKGKQSNDIGEINSGDWVTINRAYAKDHGEGALNGEYKILSKKVKAKELFTNGDSIHEFGYFKDGKIPEKNDANILRQKEGPYNETNKAVYPELKNALEKYNDTGEIATVGDLVHEVERLIDNGDAPESLKDSIDKFNEEVEYDKSLKGRGDLDSAENEFIDAIESKLSLKQNKVKYETNKANKAESDIYDGLDVRPDTTEKQKQLGRDAYREILSPYARRAGASVLGSRIAKDFKEQGGSSLHGQEAKTPEDFAVLAQVLRDPRFEKFRIFYTKNGKIVGHDAMTSNDPGSVAVIKPLPGESYNHAEQRTFNDMYDKKQRLGADGYWLLHNHPSGRATPSNADLSMTKRIAEQFPGFKGHIVIDHDEYSHIDAKGNHEMFAKGMPKSFSVNAPEIPHNALGIELSNKEDVVGVGKMLENKDGFFSLIGRTSNGIVSSIAEFPRSLLDDGVVKELRLHSTLRRFAMQTGSVDVIAVTNHADISRMEQLVKKGLLLDAVDQKGYSARDYVIGERKLFQKIKKYSIDQPTVPYGKSKLVRQGEEKIEPTIIEKAKDFVGKVKTSFDDLKKAYVSAPEFTESKKIIGEYTGKLQEIDYGLSKLAKSINKEYPKDRQEAITNYIQAGGDEKILQERSDKSSAQFKKGYDDALNLSPKEKELADFIQTQQDDYWHKANEAGIIEHYIENYVRGQWERENPAGQKIIALVNSGMLNDHPKEAMQKVFQNYAEGEQAGFIPKDKRIGFQFVAGNRSIRAAIAAREALTALMHSTEKDGRPTVSVGGGGSIMEAGSEEKPYFIKPNIKASDAQDYRSIDHPALRGWKWVGSDADGKAILMNGQMYIHPAAYGKLNALLGKSIVRSYEIPKNIPVVGGTHPGEAMLKTGAFIKSTILIGPFHQFHLGEHAVFHGVNPIGTPEINFDERPILREGVYHGLMLYNHNAMHEFAEGLASGGLWHRLPIVGDGLKRYQEWLFQDYIPRLKAAMFEKAVSRAEEHYAEHLKSGKITRDQMLDNTAKQANAAFGELNYKYMARDPSYQDALRVALLAPDFLEARMKFFGQAVRPYGREQAMALIRGAAIMGLGAQTINLMFGDDNKMHWDKPFSVIIGGREYSPRSVVGDMVHLVEDPRGFWFHRINPLWGRPLYELSTGRNMQGQKETMEEGIQNILKSWVPIPAQGIFKDQPEITTSQSIINTLLQSIGVSNFQTKSSAEKMIHDFNFDKMPQVAMTDEQVAKRKALRAIEAKIRSGEQDKAQQLFQEGQAKHIITGRDYATVIRRSVNDPMVNGFKHLDADQAQKVWEIASPEEKKKLELVYNEKKISRIRKNAQLGISQ